MAAATILIFGNVSIFRFHKNICTKFSTELIITL